MGKDPAALMYIDTWLTSTAEMDADVRGWYLNLILHNYDKSDLPNDVEKLAVLAGVKFSEYKRFEQVFEQVFKQRFEQKENGRLTNPKTFEILQKRKIFTDKRSLSGKMSYIIRFANQKMKLKKKEIDFIKENIDVAKVDTKNEQVLKQVFEHLLELYRNVDKDSIGSDVIIKDNKIPTLTEFLDHGRILCVKAGFVYKDMVFAMEQKYQTWNDSNWIDGHGSPIKNWKNKLGNTLPHLKSTNRQHGKQTRLEEFTDTDEIYRKRIEAAKNS